MTKLRAFFSWIASLFSFNMHDSTATNLSASIVTLKYQTKWRSQKLTSIPKTTRSPTSEFSEPKVNVYKREKNAQN